MENLTEKGDEAKASSSPFAIARAIKDLEVKLLNLEDRL